MLAAHPRRATTSIALFPDSQGLRMQRPTKAGCPVRRTKRTEVTERTPYSMAAGCFAAVQASTLPGSSAGLLVSGCHGRSRPRPPNCTWNVRTTSRWAGGHCAGERRTRQLSFGGMRAWCVCHPLGDGPIFRTTCFEGHAGCRHTHPTNKSIFRGRSAARLAVHF
jgi:hypothetical protein